jgi:hypothetical protein
MTVSRKGLSLKFIKEKPIILLVLAASIIMLITGTAVWAQSSELQMSGGEQLDVTCNDRGFQIERVSRTHVVLTCVEGNRTTPTTPEPQPTETPQPQPTPSPQPQPTEVPPQEPPIGQAALYVAPNGNDANPGTIDNPFQSLQHAADVAQPGYTIYIRGGVYNERLIIRDSGKAGQPITFAAYPGETPVIDGEYLLPNVPSSGWVGCNDAVSPPTCYHYKPMVHVQASFITIEGLEIMRSLGRGIVVNNNDSRVHDIVLRNNLVHDNRNASIKILEADNVLVEGNSVWHSGNYAMNDRTGSPVGDVFEPDTGWPIAVSDRRATNVTYRANRVFENWTEGIGAGLGSVGVTIEDNILYDNRALQIYIHRAQDVVAQRNLAYCTNNPDFWRGGNPPPGIIINNEEQFDGSQTTDNIEVINNIVVGCRQNFAIWGNNNYWMRDVLIAHNTFVNATSNPGEKEAVAVRISDGNQYENVRFTNNLIYQPDFKISSGSDNPGVTVRNNLWSRTPSSNMSGPGDVIGDPALVYPNAPLTAGAVVADWYQVGSGSQAIDQGEQLSEVSMDYFSNVRESQSDIGFHELMNK